jgi:hypothetical protein
MTYYDEKEVLLTEHKPLSTLCEMLTYRRVSGSVTESKFIRRWIVPLGAKPDAFGNYILRIGDSPVLFSCHTDSVHRTAGRQRLQLHNGVITVRHPRLQPGDDKPVKNVYTLASGIKYETTSYPNLAKRRQCLGADDAAGCWLMCEMAKAGVPGLYVWHRQEESGGVGSSWIADNGRDMLTGIKAAIAFDRRGRTDVITHQAGGRCASDLFAESLAGQLPPGFRPCSGGVFTDTANYTGLIGECTNISVGYDHEHQATECLDLRHAIEVRNAMVTFDASKLEYSRKPGERDLSGYARYFYGVGYRGYEKDGFEEDTKSYYRDQHARKNYAGYSAWTGANQDPADGPTDVWDQGRPTTTRNDWDAMVEMCRLNPNEVADMLQEYGMDAKGLREELYNRGASVHRL